MMMRVLIASMTLWLFTASMADGGVGSSVLVDARGTYLRTSSDDPAAAPTIVDLAANGVSPGSQIEISFEIVPIPPGGDFPEGPAGYNYGCSIPSFPFLSTEDFTFGTEDFPLAVGAGLLGVFSGSDDLKLSGEAARVTDATDAGTDIVTLRSNSDLQPTDIPQDFQIFPHTDFTVVVPLDATHLFLGVGDSYFSDNCAPGNASATYPSGAIIVTIGSSAKGLIEGAISELSAIEESIVGDPSGVGDPDAAITSLDKAIARLDSSLLSFQEDDPCRLLEDCAVGREFFKALQRAVGAIFAAIDDGGISDSDILADLESIVVGQILKASNVVAAIAIQDATAASGDPNDIAKAGLQFDMAELLTADGVSVGIAALMFFDEAVGSYSQAWRNARKAVGDCGPPGPPSPPGRP